MGGWVTSIPETDIKFRVGRQSYHHAFHVDLWRKRLPELGASYDEGAGTAHDQAPDALVGFVEALAEPAEADQTIEKLTGVYRVVLPGLALAYEYHSGHASPVADGATIRPLGFCLIDIAADWREGEAMLQSLLVDEGTVDRSCAHQARLSKLLIGAGGLAPI